MLKNVIWITGADGRLGSALKDLLKKDKKYALVTTGRDVDITDMQAVEKAIDIYQPSIVINAASESNAKYCEEHPIEAYKVNTLGARNLAIATRRKNATLIQLSTDDVFSGEHNRPKNEFDIPTPKTVYGKSKFAGENLVRELNPKHLIIRSSWLYGFKKHETDEPDNYYDQVVDMGKKGVRFTAPIDVIGTPTSARELAKFIAVIMNTNEYGIYHASCEGACTRYGYARMILEVNGLDTGLVSESFQEANGLMVSTQLDNLMMKLTGIYQMPAWTDEMRSYAASLDDK
jgi:dTDP-4-dehydrorhamnose reductase